MEKRISYIDVCKGILILMVVLGHVVYIMRITTGLALGSFPYVFIQNIASIWIAPYYMAAFFLISGYCSKFIRPLKEQIFTDGKRLVLPAIIIPLIMKIVTPPMCDINFHIFSYILYGDLPWFLMAMFWARIFFKIVMLPNIKDVYKPIFFIILSIVGCLILERYKGLEYLSFFHGLAFSLFVFIGNKLKNVKISKMWIVSVICIYISLVITCAGHVPALCADIYFGIRQWPIYIVAAFCGSLFIFQLSKFIGHNSVLEILGRNSLVIYLTHCEFLRIMSTYMIGYISKYNMSFLFSFCIILFMFVGATCWGVIWSLLLNRKYTKWIVGK